MSRQSTPSPIAAIGIDIGKNTFHLMGFDTRGAIVLQLKTSREQIGPASSQSATLSNRHGGYSGAHHIGRQITSFSHDVRFIPAQYVKPFLKAQERLSRR